jgi:hypothetical protein
LSWSLSSDDDVVVDVALAVRLGLLLRLVVVLRGCSVNGDDVLVSLQVAIMLDVAVVVLLVLVGGVVGDDDDGGGVLFLLSSLYT